jgi:hypothetical protein
MPQFGPRRTLRVRVEPAQPPRRAWVARGRWRHFPPRLRVSRKSGGRAARDQSLMMTLGPGSGGRYRGASREMPPGSRSPPRDRNICPLLRRAPRDAISLVAGSTFPPHLTGFCCQSDCPRGGSQAPGGHFLSRLPPPGYQVRIAPLIYQHPPYAEILLPAEETHSLVPAWEKLQAPKPGHPSVLAVVRARGAGVGCRRWALVYPSSIEAVA